MEKRIACNHSSLKVASVRTPKQRVTHDANKNDPALSLATCPLESSQGRRQVCLSPILCNTGWTKLPTVTVSTPLARVCVCRSAIAPFDCSLR